MATAAESTEDKVAVQAEKMAAIRTAIEAESRARVADHAALLVEVRAVRDNAIGKTEFRIAGFVGMAVMILLILLLAESRGVDTRAAVEGTTTILSAGQEAAR